VFFSNPSPGLCAAFAAATVPLSVRTGSSDLGYSILQLNGKGLMPFLATVKMNTGLIYYTKK
jgi:hypothetical protein